MIDIAANLSQSPSFLKRRKNGHEGIVPQCQLTLVNLDVVALTAAKGVCSGSRESIFAAQIVQVQ
jgi:hypothetical protein